VKVIRISRPHDPLPGIDSCCTVTPFSGTPVGSNTKTDDDCRRRQFSIGALPVRSSLSRFHITMWRTAFPSNSSEFMKTKEINIYFVVNGFRPRLERAGNLGILFFLKRFRYSVEGRRSKAGWDGIQRLSPWREVESERRPIRSSSRSMSTGGGES